ncbi:GGDEF domain-containing protein [Novosphingobium piscinae]|uniref:diguanylate cyclase n=2 Tax=Novosphingobium piscinae TaxID=1507448 RepID=A0A7X1FYX7_9SPHN|nr:GGDEF domain-containing protein [Novosphingobium piscinae]
MTAFLARHGLRLSQSTLLAAYDCVTGNDPRLALAVAERDRAGEPISLDWLVGFRRGEGAQDELIAVTKLMERLERSLESFSHTTTAARSATNEYTLALRDQVDELQQGGDTGAMLADVLAIARTMIERTHEIERHMIRSEQETQALHRSLEETRRHAELDHLTGLPNRRAFEHRLDREVVAARAAGDPLCVAFCDIDRFKRINDTHGHDAGDRVLRAVACALNEISDERCHVARHGGEEFVVLFRGLALNEAYERLDETRDSLAERRMVNRATDVPFGKVTFSAGIANVFDYPQPREALKAADEALYVAKQDGRNRIVRATPQVRLISGPPKAA